MGYVYSNPWADAAVYGGEAGRSLAQAIYGVPKERAQMQMELMQLRQQQQYRQNMMDLRQEQTKNSNDYHQGLLQEQNARLQQQGEYNQNRLQSLDQYRQMMEQVRMLQAQVAQQNAQSLGGYRQFQEQRPYSLGNGAIYDPRQLPASGQVAMEIAQPGMAPQGPGLPQDQGRLLPMQQGLPQQGQPQPGIPQQGLPQGVSQLPMHSGQGAPGSQNSLIGKLNAQVLNGMGTNATPAQQAYIKTNVIPLLMGLQQKSQGLPQQVQQPQAQRIFNWDPVSGSLTNSMGQ